MKTIGYNNICSVFKLYVLREIGRNIESSVLKLIDYEFSNNKLSKHCIR